MKYTFKDQEGKVRTANIDDAELGRLQRSISGTQQEAIELWLFDHGYMDNEVVEELTAKAKANKCGVGKVGNKQKKPRKPRPADEEKRMLISMVAERMQEYGAEIANPEREITFTLGQNEYSITLTRHRPKK